MVADEVYYFKKAIKPQKEPSSVLIPQVGQTSMMDVDNEDSMDAPSVGSTDSPMPGTQSTKKVWNFVTSTQWKSHDFSVIHILREINFGES